MAESTLQSFLIKLRYAVDNDSLKKYQEGVEGSIKSLQKMQLAAAAAIFGVEEMVRRTTAAAAQLGHLSNTTGITALNLEKLGGFFKGAGLSADQAAQSVQQLTEQFLNPGIKGFAETIVGPFKTADEFIVKATEKYAQLQKLADQGDENAKQSLRVLQTQLEQFNVPWMQLARNAENAQKQALATEEIYKRMHVNADQAAQGAIELQNRIDNLGKTFDVFFKKLILDPKVAQGIDKILTGIQNLLTDPKTVEAIGRITNAIGDFLQDTEKVKLVVEAIVGIFVVGWGLKAVSAIMTVVRAVRMLSSGISGVASGAGAAAEGIAKMAGAGARGAGVAGAGAGAGAGLGVGLAGLAAVLGTFYLTKDWAKEHAGVRHYGPKDQRDYGDFNLRDWLHGLFTPSGSHPSTYRRGGQPSFQGGGIVPINAHAGEMVLPTQISAGLQSFFMSSSDNSIIGTSKKMLDSFVSWWSGDSSYKPQVSLDDDTIKRLGGKDAGAGGGGGGGTLGGVPVPPGTGPGEPVPGGGVNAPADQPESATERALPGGTGSQTLAENRKRLAEELQQNPALREKLLNIAATEQDNPQGNQAVIETMFNRAAALGTTLAAQIRRTSEGGYYAGSDDPAKLAHNRKMIEDNLAKVISGSNISNYATDNASNQPGNRLADKRIAGNEMQLRYQAGGEFFFSPNNARISGAGTLQRYQAWLGRIQAGEQQVGPSPPAGEGGGGRWLGGGKGARPELLNTLSAAVEHYLPAGYKAYATSGERGAGPEGSQHKHGNAMDVQIVGPDGKPILNRGGDTTGMYGKLAHGFFMETARQYPQLLNRTAWGGEFGTALGGGGEQDLMHYDYGGRRGRYAKGNWHYIDSDQTVNIHVHGNESASETAKAVQHTQDRASAMHIRNLRSHLA